ncbi:unnamed protein product [Prorocentrum cordatum]|uniref:Uncharacterized protein n=1 Tax=Prorocentrum cordatum TaxID=2364126 RepID=A0ABN9SMM8_9DINO|nr:unnamed protein product [Polarella glacialis]
MASLTAGGVKSMGEIVGGDASATDQIENTWLRMASVQSYKTLDKPERVQSDPPAAFVLRDVPLQCADNVANAKHLVDWVTLEDAPFKPNKDAGEIAFTMQLRTLPKGANGEQCALKYVRFDNKGARHPLGGGSADTKTPLNLFHYMMDRLGGVQIRHWVQPSVAAAVGGGGYDKEKRRAGYRFIEEFGPRANNRNQFAEWTDEQINDEKSPIFGWQASEVKESLRNYASGSVGARTLERWAITLKRFHPFVFDNIVVPILKSHDVHGTMWIGKTRVGKSTKIDFSRLEPGTVHKPAIADDTALTKWAPDEIIAFLDPAEEDALLRARRGGASFEQNQPRQICANPYDQEFEKKVCSIRRGQQVVKFDDFLKIIDRNFAGEKQRGYQTADVEACMAGSNIALLTDDWMHLRLASTTKDPAPRFPWPVPEKPDLFTPETTPILKRFKKDQTFAPPDYGAHIKWAVAAMKKLARGEDTGRSRTVRGPTLFDQDAPPRYEFAAMDGEMNVGADASAAVSAAAPPAPAIPGNPDDDDADSGLGGEMRGAAAAEDEEDVFGFGGGMDGVFRQRLQKSKDCGAIHLDTPTPKKKRTDIEEDLSQMLEASKQDNARVRAHDFSRPPRTHRNCPHCLTARQKKTALDRAWDFVQAEAPRGNFDGQRVLWLEHQYVDPDSPVGHMKREFVNSLLKCIADRDHFATKEDYHPLLKRNVRKEYQPMTNRTLQTLTCNTMHTIGEAGFGKVGEPWAPCALDDGDLADQRPRVVKAFFDPTQAEAMTYARWGAAKFVRGQARRLANSKCRGRPGAMLKRCNVALSTQHSFFFRPAGKDSVVEKLPPMSTYITAEAGNILMRPLKHKKRRDQEECDRLFAFEKKDMLKPMAEARDAAGARGDGGDGAAAAAAGGAPACAAALREARQSGGVWAAPEDDDVFCRRGGADARADVADEEGVLGFGGGMGAAEPAPPKELTAARNARVELLIKSGTNKGMIVPWQAGAASGSSGGASAPNGAAAPADAAPEAQPLIVGCRGALPEEDHCEQMAIFRSLAKARHGACKDLVTAPRKTTETGLARGGPPSPVSLQEQQAIFAWIASQAHGGTVAIDDGDVDLDAEMEAMLEADEPGGDVAMPISPTAAWPSSLIAMPTEARWGQPAANAAPAVMNRSRMRMASRAKYSGAHEKHIVFGKDQGGNELGWAGVEADEVYAAKSGGARTQGVTKHFTCDVGAMLKRCNVALSTQHSFFFRPAGKDSVVEKLPPMSTYITAEAGNILMRPLKHKKRRDQEECDRLFAFEKKDMLKPMAEARDAAGARGDGGDGAAAAAAGGAPACAAALREARQSGGVWAAPEDDDVFCRRGGADARADVADEEGVLGFGGGMGAAEPAPPKELTAARNARVELLIKSGTNKGMIVPWQAGAASGSSGGASAPNGAAAPADAAPEAQPLIVGCRGALPEEDHCEQMAIFRSLAKARHGACKDLVTAPRKTTETGLARGGPPSPVSLQEQQAIFAWIASQAHGGTVAIDDGDVDLDAEMEAMLEADEPGGDVAMPISPTAAWPSSLIAMPTEARWGQPAANAAPAVMNRSRMRMACLPALCSDRSRVRNARAKYSGAHEKHIVFGKDQGGNELGWAGVEADEVYAAKSGGARTQAPACRSPSSGSSGGGIVQRGSPGPLALFRLKPGKAKRRAPGPGPTRKGDWAPKAPRWLKLRRAILHADGARSHRLKIDGALRDWVVRKKKKAKLGGKLARAKPAFTKLIERASGDLRRAVGKGTARAAGSALPRNKAAQRDMRSCCLLSGLYKARSFQWAHWNRGGDLWLATGQMPRDAWAKDHAAARKIQSVHRGKAARQEVADMEQRRKELAEEENAATKIQAKYRGMATRKSMHGVDVSPSPVRRVSAQAEELVSKQVLQGAGEDLPTGTDEENAAAAKIQDGGEKSRQECLSALVDALGEDDKAKDECVQALLGNVMDGGEKSRQECMSALVGALGEDDKAKDECVQALLGNIMASGDRNIALKSEMCAALEMAMAALLGPEAEARAEVRGALRAALAEDLPAGTDEENAAAARIQEAVHRGKKARLSVAEQRAAAAGSAREEDVASAAPGRGGRAPGGHSAAGTPRLASRGSSHEVQWKLQSAAAADA